MFKKSADVSEKSRSLLKNKDTRNLKNDVIQQFPALTEDDIASIFVNSHKIIGVKLPHRTVLYLDSLDGNSAEGVPLFFDLHGSGVLYPTINFLGLYPRCLPTFHVNTMASTFILNGADLMYAGVINPAEGLEAVNRHERRTITVIGNPIPFAVGEVLVDIPAQSNDPNVKSVARRGKCLGVTHLFGDGLCKSFGLGYIPNDGFSERIVCPIGVDPNSFIIEPNIPNQEEDNINDNHDTKAVDNTADRKEVDTPTIPATNFDYASMSPDGLLIHSFYRSIKYVMREANLPLLASAYYSSTLLPSVPKGHAIDLKSTSFKKVTSFLAVMSSDGLITCKTTAGVCSIISVNKSHPTIMSFHDSDCIHLRELVESNSGRDGRLNPVTSVDLYKLTRPYVRLFGELRGKYGNYLTLNEIKSVIFSYLKANEVAVEDALESDVTPEAASTNGLTAELYELLLPQIRRIDGKSRARDTSSSSSSSSSNNKNDDDDNNNRPSHPAPSKSKKKPKKTKKDDHPPPTSKVSEQMERRSKTRDRDVDRRGKRDKRTMDDDIDALPEFVMVERDDDANEDNDEVEEDDELNNVKMDELNVADVDPEEDDDVVEDPVPLVNTDTVLLSSQAQQLLPTPPAKSVSFSSSIITPPTVPVLPQETIISCFVNAATPYHALIGGLIKDCVIISGSVVPISIHVEALQRSKVVTHVRNFAKFGIDAEVMAKECKKLYATSTSLEGNESDQAMLLLGHWSVEVEEYLREKGVGENFVSVTLGTGVKANKNSKSHRNG